MKIYLLKLTEDFAIALASGEPLDYLRALVVFAEDENQAREMAAEKSGDEGWQAWKSPEKTTCEELSPEKVTAHEVIVSDFVGH